MSVPVVIFVYNRPEHTKQTIDALGQNFLATETDLVIYSDAAKNEKALENVRLVRKYLDSLLDDKRFKTVKVIKANKNKGLAKSVIEGINSIFQYTNCVIVLEDDLITSKNFLLYMNKALGFYEKDPSIWSISGYSYNLDLPSNYNDDLYLSYRASSWGWATWKDRWELVDWEVKDYNQFKSDRVLQSNLSRGGRDMVDMLHSQLKGEIDSWAIRWCYSQSKLNMLTVYPTVSKVKNIGIDGSGTHSGVAPKFNVNLDDGSEEIAFKKLNINKEIIKSFRDFYMTRNEYINIKMRVLVKRILRMS